MHTHPAADARFRVALLGLDGLSLDIAKTIAAFGRTPHLEALCQDPGVGTVDAELPELSPVNWTSVATGEGPQVHGIYGFTTINPVTYAISITDARHIRVPSVFDRLGERGLTCRVLNLPGQWPVRPGPQFKGTLLAGFVAPSLDTSVHPPALAAELRQAGYRIEADTLRGAGDPAYLLAQLQETLRGRRYLMQRFLAPGDFDCMCCVFTETDRLFHFLLPAVLEADHPWHAACLDFLVDWDAAVGEFFRLARALPGETRIMAVADHGFAPLETEFDVNAWLQAHGFLRVEERVGSSTPPNPLDASVIRAETTAFALDPGRIFLHRQGAFARGGVTPDQEQALLERIRTGLKAQHWNGQPVMEEVFLGRDLYPGEAAPGRPDLVCLSRVGVDLKAKFDRRELFGHYGRNGMHTAHGALFYDSMAATAGPPPQRMRDVGRRLLEAFDQHARGLVR